MSQLWLFCNMKLCTFKPNLIIDIYTPIKIRLHIDLKVNHPYYIFLESSETIKLLSLSRPYVGTGEAD